MSIFKKITIGFAALVLIMLVTAPHVQSQHTPDMGAATKVEQTEGPKKHVRGIAQRVNAYQCEDWRNATPRAIAGVLSLRLEGLSRREALNSMSSSPKFPEVILHAYIDMGYNLPIKPFMSEDVIALMIGNVSRKFDARCSEYVKSGKSVADLYRSFITSK